MNLPVFRRRRASVESGAAAPPTSRAWPGKVLVAVALLFLTAATAAVALFALSPIPDPQINVAPPPMETPPDTPIVLSVPRYAVDLPDPELTESTLDQDGQVVSSRLVPVELVPAEDGEGTALTMTVRLRRSDGGELLQYDHLYQLAVKAEKRILGFTLSTRVEPARSYSFRTLTTPKVIPAVGEVELNYQEPAQVQWTSPIKDFSVEITPTVDHLTSVDPIRRDLGYVELIDPVPGQRYEIRVVQGTGSNGAPLLSTSSLTVRAAAPPMPHLERVKLIDGDLVSIPWDRPVRDLKYEIAPEVQTVVEADPSDPRVTTMRLLDAAQGQQYAVTITGGVGDNGAPLESSYRFSVDTPPPLEIIRFRPRHGSFGVDAGTPIDITFSQPIRDPASVESAITISPEFQANLEWLEPNHLRFVPVGTMPYETQVTVHFAGGRSGLRGETGSYLAAPNDFTFETVPDKIIDVDLSKQRLTLLEHGEPVFTTLVSTGVRGAETPVGLYNIEYKMPKTRMQGVNPSGRSYDLPDVPWVMSFLGNYTLHGAYWRDNYGTPQSNGCVSMPIPAAKYVYDWAPEGTPVSIHY